MNGVPQVRILQNHIAGEVMPCVIVGEECDNGTDETADYVPYAEVVASLFGVSGLFPYTESKCYDESDARGYESRGKVDERCQHTCNGGNYELTEDVELLVAPGLVITDFCHS